MSLVPGSSSLDSPRRACNKYSMSPYSLHGGTTHDAQRTARRVGQACMVDGWGGCVPLLAGGRERVERVELLCEPGVEHVEDGREDVLLGRGRKEVRVDPARKARQNLKRCTLISLAGSILERTR